MTLEGVPIVAESHEEQRAKEYAEVVNRCRSLIDVLPETEELSYREKAADTPELRAMAKLELIKDSLQGEADAYAEQGERHAERGARMLEQVKEAEMKILGVYCDAKQDSEELAALIAEMYPFVTEHLAVANTELADQSTAA